MKPYCAALSLNRLLAYNREHALHLVFDDLLIAHLNQQFTREGEHWLIHVVYKNQNLTDIKRFDLIDYNSGAQIVTDENGICWFE